MNDNDGGRAVGFDVAFVVVQALMRPRVNAGAICSTGAASSALTGEIDSARSASVRAFDGAR